MNNKTGQELSPERLRFFHFDDKKHKVDCSD